MGFVNLILLGTLRGYLHSLIIFEVDLVLWLDIKIPQNPKTVINISKLYSEIDKLEV